MIGPREWVGTAAFPWPPADTVEPGAALVGCYCVLTAQRDMTKSGKPYYKLQLVDRHGQVDARVWDPVLEVMERIRQGGYVGVRGTVEIFNGSRQLRVTEVLPIEIGPEDLELFLPSSPRDPQSMETELATLIASVADEGLRALLTRILDPESETGQRFRRAPAAKHNHHAYVGGLLEHTLSIARSCALMAEHYWPAVDRDLLVAGALLHDLGKTRELGTQAGFPYTDEGKLMGHILIGLQMVAETAREVPELAQPRLLLLQHLIASHQGRYEWQSPREPRILEAIILHYCDDLDAKMNQALALLATVEGGWTGHDRAFGREMMRHFGVSDAAQVRDPSTGEGPPRRRKIRFAGKFPGHAAVRPPEEPPSPGSAGTTAPAENGGGQPTTQAREDALAAVEDSGPVAENELEALPPRRVALPPDILPPDPNSLDLFN